MSPDLENTVKVLRAELARQNRINVSQVKQLTRESRLRRNVRNSLLDAERQLKAKPPRTANALFIIRSELRHQKDQP